MASNVFSPSLRRLATTQCRSISRTASRPFTSSLRAEKKQEIGSEKANKTHTLDKADEPNLQSYESKKGRENRANDTGGVATQQKDPGAKKAKEEFPEAPDTIGFQDERGGKGH